MNSYKTIDVFLQTVLIALSTLGMAFTDSDIMNPLNFIIALGVVQVISIIVHLGAVRLPWKQKSLRKIHLIGTLLVFLLLLISFIKDTSYNRTDKDDKYAMPGLDVLVYAAGLAMLMIVFYTIISWIEWRKLKTEK